MFQEFKTISLKKELFKNLNQKKIILSFLKNFLKKYKIETEVEIKFFPKKIFLYSKNPTIFHFLKLKEREIKYLFKNQKDFEIEIKFKHI